MAWTTPTDRTTGYTVTAADWNIVEDNLSFLYGDTTWTAVSAFSGTWTASVAVAYILVGRYVSLRGVVTGGTINTTAFTLPAGYRPALSWGLTVNSNGAVGFVTVGSTGAVVPTSGSATNVNLFCTFPVAS